MDTFVQQQAWILASKLKSRQAFAVGFVVNFSKSRKVSNQVVWGILEPVLRLASRVLHNASLFPW